MLASEVIDKIGQEIKTVPSNSLEKVYQRSLEKLIATMGLQVSHESGHAGGTPDLFISDSEPPILIEIKQSGDWRCVGEAVAQLWTYGVGKPPETQKVAVFGGPLMHEAHKSMLDKLGIQYVIKER